MRPRIGICGAGRISSFHANSFLRADCEVVAFADPRMDAASALAKTYGAQSYNNLDAMIAAGNLDIVCIATPHDLHAPQATRALEAGLDVFMDKPIAVSPQEGRNLVDLAARLGRRLGVNHNLLFHPAIVMARDLIEQGHLGIPVSATAWSTGWLVMGEHDFRLDRDKTGGGAWVDAGPHLIYTLMDLLGPISELVPFLSNGPSRMGGEDTVVAVARFDNGAVANLRVSYSYTGPGSKKEWPSGWFQGMEINGSEGALRLTVTPKGIVEKCRLGDDEWTPVGSDLEFAKSFDGAVGDLVTARSGATQPYVTPENSLFILELIHGSMAAQAGIP